MTPEKDLIPVSGTGSWPPGAVSEATATFVVVFETAPVLDNLDHEQCRAATWPGGPLLVLAGAGTGKTRTLVARAAWLRGQGLEPGRILLLTFTRRAADEMLSRSAPGSGAGSPERITGGTFHAIAHRIIRRHAESFSLPPQFTVIDPGDVTDLLDVLRAQHGLVSAERRAPRAAVCADIYTRCVNTQQPAAEVVRTSYPWCTPFTSRLAELFRGYVGHKRSHSWSTSTTCCCSGAPRWPTTRRARRCAACSTRSWSTSTRTSTPCRPTSSGCSSPTARG